MQTYDRTSIKRDLQHVLTAYRTPATTAGRAVDNSSAVDQGAFFTPYPLGYAVGWLVASVIVSERYHDSAIDVLPVYHPEHGWDRFLLTRRVSCALLGDEASNAFGMIGLTGTDAPNITSPDGTVLLSLGNRLGADLDQTLNQVMALFPEIGLVDGDHRTCLHTRAPRYPSLYRVIAGLIAHYPGLTGARELVIDDQQIDGAYHPLFLHTARQQVGTSYDWFALHHSATARFPAFVRISGSQSVYRTDQETWAAPRVQLATEKEEEMRRHLLSWLRLDSVQTVNRNE